MTTNNIIPKFSNFFLRVAVTYWVFLYMHSYTLLQVVTNEYLFLSCFFSMVLSSSNLLIKLLILKIIITTSSTTSICIFLLLCSVVKHDVYYGGFRTTFFAYFFIYVHGSIDKFLMDSLYGTSTHYQWQYTFIIRLKYEKAMKERVICA